VVDKGPEVTSVQQRNGKVYIRFDQSIRISKGDRPRGFEVGYKEGKTGRLRFVSATAKRKKNTIVVWSEEDGTPVQIRYAWLLANEGNISNPAGLPAYPFRNTIH